MKMNHLGLPCRNLLEEQEFYCRYFGFAVAREDGFLMNKDGFVLVLDPVDRPVTQSEGLHYGFFSSSQAELRALYQTMRDDGVKITAPPVEEHGMLVFFCADPEGYSVEVRALEA